MRKHLLHLLLPLFMLLSQQGAVWHGIGHLSGPHGGAPSGQTVATAHGAPDDGKTYADADDLSTEQLSETLTMAGLEVEELQPVAPAFTQIVVGEIKEAAQHPNADRLRVCQVDVGQGSLLNIVCGAPNARVGIRVPCALVGAELPHGPQVFFVNVGQHLQAAEVGDFEQIFVRVDHIADVEILFDDHAVDCSFDFDFGPLALEPRREGVEYRVDHEREIAELSLRWDAIAETHAEADEPGRRATLAALRDALLQ